MILQRIFNSDPSISAHDLTNSIITTLVPLLIIACFLEVRIRIVCYAISLKMILKDKKEAGGIEPDPESDRMHREDSQAKINCRSLLNTSTSENSKPIAENTKTVNSEIF